MASGVTNPLAVFFHKSHSGLYKTLTETKYMKLPGIADRAEPDRNVKLMIWNVLL